MRLLALLLVALVAAGCLAPQPEVPAPAPGPTPADLALMTVADHDHLDPAEHAFSLNATRVAWLPLAPEGKRAGAHALALHGSLLAVGIVGDAGRGVALVDVADPAAPALLGTWDQPGLAGLDRTVAFSEDGQTVFVGREPASSSPQGYVDGLGVYAVDVSDPTAPTTAGHFPNPRYGAHTVFAREVDGTQYVYLMGLGLVVLSYDAGADAFTLVSRWATTTPGQLLENPVEEEPAYASSYPYHALYGHDVFVDVDDSGRPLAYIAYAWEGLKVLDLSDPRLPVEVATWIPRDEHAPWYVHTVDVARVGDRTIAMVGSEVFNTRHVDAPSPIWAVDVTDPAAPVELGRWVNPAEQGSASLLFSAHDLRIRGDRVALAHYHGGSWVLDLPSLMANAEPAVAVRAAWLTADTVWDIQDEDIRAGLETSGIPMAFDVTWIDDVHVATADLHGGLSIHRVGSA